MLNAGGWGRVLHSACANTLSPVRAHDDQADWKREMAEAGTGIDGTMAHPAFHSSMFELAGAWRSQLGLLHQGLTLRVFFVCGCVGCQICGARA